MKLKKLILILAAIWAGILSPLLAAGTQQLHGHVPDAVFRLHLSPFGNLPATNVLRLSIGLPLRNQDQLTNRLEQIYNHASPSWHHYLTVDQFTKEFGPTETDYESVVTFARTNGFKIEEEPTNRMLVEISAPVPQIEKAFHIHLLQYHHPTENRLFYAPDTEPSLDLRTPVLHVSGLDNFQRPMPGGHLPTGKEPGGAGSGSGPSGSWRGKDFRNTYAPGVTLTGAGQTVGLVEFDGYYSNDIATYATQSSLPVVPLTNVLIDGFGGLPNTGESGDEFEVSLDIEMAASMAPGLSRIMVYEAGNYNSGDDMMNRMATDNQAQQLSCSYWFSYDPTTAQIFQEFAMQGQSFFIISYDDDAFNAAAGAPIDAPIDYPYAVVVGGTTLTTTSGAWTSETVWNFNNGSGSGGGISTNFSIPSWQQPVNMSSNGGSTAWRNIPDVACVASGFYVIYDTNVTTTGGWGTSFATPLWAGFAALANQQAASYGEPRLGFLNPLIYEIGQSSYYSTAFHDITTGSNTNKVSPNAFFAVPGYDLCTGWGTPNGTNLINLLAPPLTPIYLGNPVLSGGTLLITASGLAYGLTNYLQTSTNLTSSSSWTSIQTNVATNSVMTFTGLGPRTKAPAKFYRLLELP